MYGGITLPESRVGDCCFIARPNCSLSLAGKLVVLMVLAVLVFGIAVAFAMMGAWLVLPFAGLEMLVVGLAFYQVTCHEQDYERLTVQGGTVTLEKRDNVRLAHEEFSRYWSRVSLQCCSVGRQCRLVLSSSGREVEFGRYLDDGQRIALHRELQIRLGC